MRRKFKFSQVVTPAGAAPLKGEAMGNLRVYEPGEILEENGLILEVGERTSDADITFDYQGKLAIPGLVDSHNHLPFAGERLDEFEMKLRGASYMEIAKAGGGIRSTVKATREASFDELFQQSKSRAFWLLKNGTTSLEAKSGYGLNLEDEIKQLEVAMALDQDLPMDVVPVFLGGHDIPPDRDKDSYIQHLTQEIIPEVASKGLSKYFDAFCEEGIYSPSDVEKMFRAALEHGLRIRLHTDEFTHTGAIPMAVEMGAVSVDHILFASEEDIEKLAASDTVGVLMPTVSFFLRMEKYAPARKIIDMGGAVALGTDFNPGSSPAVSMFFPLWLSVFRMGLSMEEALTAATINSAFVLGLDEKVGSLKPGKKADFLVLDFDDYRKIFYYFSEPRLIAVYKEGRKVISLPRKWANTQ